jgi:hypothetical protein
MPVQAKKLDFLYTYFEYVQSNVNQRINNSEHYYKEVRICHGSINSSVNIAFTQTYRGMDNNAGDWR